MRFITVLAIIFMAGVAGAESTALPTTPAHEALNAEGFTALSEAVKRCDVEKVTSLLQSGNNPNARNKDDTVPLMWLGYYQNPPEATKLHIAQLLVTHGADLNARDREGKSVVDYQVIYRLEGVLSYLVSKGASVQNETALRMAIEGGRVEAVKTLLAAGANPNQERIIWAAMHYESEEVRQAMLASSQVNLKSPLWVQLAAQEGRQEIVKQLIAKGADINTPGEGNQTALHFAIDGDKTEAAKALIAAGVNIEQLSDSGYGSANGETALCLASRKGNAEVVQALIAAKANVNASCKPIVSAAEIGNVAIVTALVEAGADLQDRYTGNWEALFSAAEKDHAEIAEQLIKGRVRIDVRGHLDQTPLMVAAGSGSLQMIRLLVKHGANLEATNARRPISDTGTNFIGTPLAWALEQKQDAAAALLRELGAKH